MTFNFNTNFFLKNQKRLLKVANSVWLRWFLGLHRLPKEIKGLKIDKITPNSIHHKVETKLTKKGSFRKQKYTAEFFTRPRFAEALAYNLSPFCYFQELRSQKFSWRFSPAGLAYILLFGLLGKFAGLPLAFMGTTTSYYAGAGDGFCEASNANWNTAHDSSTANEGYGLTNIVASSYWDKSIQKFGQQRGFAPTDTSGLGSGATISAVTFNGYVWSLNDQDNVSCAYLTLVQTSQASTSNLVSEDFDQCGAIDNPTEGIDTGERKDISSISNNAYLVFTLNSTGRGWINKTGYSLIGIREGHDTTDTSMPNGGAGTSYYCNVIMRSSAYTGTSQDPYLSVTYTTVTAPTVTTQAASSVLSTSFTGNGNITATGGANATRRGFAYALGASNPNSLDLELSSSQYAYLSDNSKLDMSGDFTIEAWVKLKQLPSSAGANMNIVIKGPGASDGGYRLFTYNSGGNNVLAFYWWNTTTDTTAQTAGAFFVAGDVGNWVHVAASADISAGTVVIYKNGVSQSVTQDGSPATTITNTTRHFTIGGFDYDTPQQYLDGMIDEVRVWTDIRSEAEIQANYQKELNGDETNLVGYWKFNNSYLDETSNNNDLTASGSPVFSSSVPFGGDPTTSDSVAYDDGDFGTGAFTKSVTGLDAETAYRARAYATNSAGTSYGATVDVTTGAATSPGNFFQFFLILLAITFLTGCGVNAVSVIEPINNQQVEIIGAKKPTLTPVGKQRIKDLTAKSDKKSKDKDKLNMNEALEYIKDLNDIGNDTKEYDEVGVEEVYEKVKTNLLNKTK